MTRRRTAAPLLSPRPQAPDALVDDLRHPEAFVAAPELAAWIHGTFLDPAAPLHNPEHEHLTEASLGCLWTNAVNRRQMRTALATAEIAEPRGAPWVKARQEYQLVQWFRAIPDFVLTFDAPLCTALGDAAWCAVVEHELYHCAHARTADGEPRYHRDGTPMYGIRGHDVEQFVGVVRRYGADAAMVRGLVAAAAAMPLVAGADAAFACGTCLGRAA